MKFSKLEFKNPVLLNLVYSVNNDFNSPNPIEMRIHTSVNTERLESDSKSATVTVTVEVGEQNQNSPFYISVQEQAEFRWDSEDSFSEDELKNLLKKNAVALLIGYIRPIIASITNCSPYPVFNLPFIDLRST